MKNQGAPSAILPVVGSAVDTLMRVRVQGTSRPICVDCGHSMMSHGEREGVLFCWGCLAINKKCEPKTEQMSTCVK